MDTAKIKPSRGWYAVAGVIFVAGICLFGYLTYQSIIHLTRGLTQMVIPGDKILTFDKPGTYTIYNEYHSVVGNKYYSNDQNISGIECEVLSKNSGTKIQVYPATVHETYNINNRDGVSLFNFKITQPGDYIVYGRYSNNQTGPDIVLTVGNMPIVKMVFTLFGAIATLFGTLILSIGIFIIVLVLRYSAKKKLSAISTY